MKNIIKSLLTVALLSAFQTSYAEKPNVWVSGTGQGFTAYIIRSSGITVDISCNYASMPSYDHSIIISRYNPKTRNAEEIFTFADNRGDGEFVIDGISYYPSTPTDTNFSSGEWRRFTTAMSKAKKFELKIKEKTVAVFTPTPKSVKDIASDMKQCEDMITLRNTIFRE